MKREAVNPSGLYQSVPFGFSHAVESEGGRLLHLAGQVAWDAEANLVGEGDLAAQAKQALDNLTAVLAD
ncbi:MAG: Rid family hydrolase, partial [Pseudomonadota bacterium]